MHFPRLGKRVVLLVTFMVSLVACQDNANSQSAITSKKSLPEAEVIKIGSLDELMTLFEELDYTRKSWEAGSREVPRITFDRVSENWKKTSMNMPVPLKKQVFFRLMAPLVLMSNENILLERQQVIDSPLDSAELISLARKYKIIADTKESLSDKDRQALLARVDILPPSLVLAQAAEESGWGTSRFTSEGNSFFGQWDFSGNGMVPAQQRKELGNYGLARFDSPLDSVEGYMLNINTHNAYKKLRDLRIKIRAKDKLITGHELAGTLDKYSERGQAYIDGIREMIRYNGLGPADEAYLSDNRVIRLVGKDEK